MYHIISLHGVVTLLDCCRRYRVHYRLLSTCVGSFTCPDIDSQVRGTTVFSLIRQTLFVCALAVIEPTHWSFLDCKSSVLTTRPAGQYVSICGVMVVLDARLEMYRVNTARIGTNNSYLAAHLQCLWTAAFMLGSISHCFGDGVSWVDVRWRSAAIPQVRLDVQW
jgi:hypothetical protein